MNIKFNLENVNVRHEEVQIEIGQFFIEVTDVDLKEYTQLVKEIPALIKQINTASTQAQPQPSVREPKPREPKVDADAIYKSAFEDGVAFQKKKQNRKDAYESQLEALQEDKKKQEMKEKFMQALNFESLNS